MGKPPKPAHPREPHPKADYASTTAGTPAIPERKPGSISAESASQLFDFVQNASDMLYIHDLTGDFTWVNPAACRIMGYTYEEATKLNMVDVVAPEHWGLAREMAQRKLQGELTSSQYEINLIGKDGRRIPAEVSTQLAVE